MNKESILNANRLQGDIGTLGGVSIVPDHNYLLLERDPLAILDGTKKRTQPGTSGQPSDGKLAPSQCADPDGDGACSIVPVVRLTQKIKPRNLGRLFHIVVQ